MNRIPTEGLAAFPGILAALAAWMPEFDRVKATPWGPIRCEIRPEPSGDGVTVRLLLGDWQAVSVLRGSLEAAPEAFGAVAGALERARLEVLFRVATRGGVDPP